MAGYRWGLDRKAALLARESDENETTQWKRPAPAKREAQ